MTDPNVFPLLGRRILVTDGDQRAALAIVRSLGAAGAELVVCSPHGRSIAGASRFAAAEVQVPEPLEKPETFVSTLPAVLERHGIECLLPVTEASLRPILRSRELFGDVVVPFPSYDTFSAASDKRRVTRMAGECGVPVPRQVVIDGPGSSQRGDIHDLGFPLVLKPATSVAEDAGGSVKLSVRHVAEPGQLDEAIDALPTSAYPLLVQERVLGMGLGIFLLRWNGRILARFAHKRLREKPPSGGVSVYRESIVPPVDALAHAETLLETLDWEGVAMIEFKQAPGGPPYLMEINGRFWGSLQLAIDAGVDFPRLLAEAAFGRPPERVVEGRPGVRLRWLLGDLDHLLLRLRRSSDDLNLDADSPGRLEALGAFLLPWRPGERWEVLRPSDPRPFGRELRDWVRSAISGRSRL